MSRQAPLVRCGCGRLHRTWNPHKVCRLCIREQRSGVELARVARVLELEEARARRQASAELAAERAALHARWLARQPADHPWRRSSSSSPDTPTGFTSAAGGLSGGLELDTQLTLDTCSRVASGGGEA